MQDTYVISFGASVFVKARGPIISMFVEENGTIESLNYVDKFQKQASSPYNMSQEMVHVSIFPFVYENKMGYLFNDAIKNHKAPAPKTKKHFVFAKDVGIYMVNEENKEKPQLTALTGSMPANRYLCELLFVEDNKLIVLTRDRETAYIETIHLP